MSSKDQLVIEQAEISARLHTAYFIEDNLRDEDLDQAADEVRRIADGYKKDLEAVEAEINGHPPSIPEGYVLVPVEPTARMLTAAKEAFPENDEDWYFHHSNDVIHTYRAMIAAAANSKGDV